MDNIQVIYWSSTGNTKAMADAIAEGIVAGGKIAAVTEVSNLQPSDLQNDSVFALGCPAMGAEQLEESEMEPFVQTLESMVANKTILLFGSYGWGDGQWMRDWVDRMSQAGATVLGGEDAIVNETPDESSLSILRNLGTKLATL